MKQHYITRTDDIGYSYGAEKAATAAECAFDYDIEAERGIWMEPVAVAQRGLLRLLKDFQSAGVALDDYVQGTDSEPYLAARQEAASGRMPFARYIGGLLRASNIAIAHALSTDSFGVRADAALLAQANMQANIIWGTDSELSLNMPMLNTTKDLQKNHSEQRVHGRPVVGMRHAGGDDIDLHAALVLEAYGQG
jgi:hypothetical protein